MCVCVYSSPKNVRPIYGQTNEACMVSYAREAGRDLRLQRGGRQFTGR